MVKGILRKILCVFIVLCIAVSMSGCSLYVVSLDKLLRAPMSDPDIEKTINKKLGSAITLLSPSIKDDNNDSDYLSSTFNYADLDSDGKEEVICFYSEKSAPEKIHVLILKTVEDKWEIVSDTVGSGNEILSLLVVDLSDSGSKQIVTTWKYVEKKILNISSFSSESNGIAALCKDMRFDEIEMVDVDSDDYSEILVISYDPSSFTDGNVSFLSVLDVDASGKVSVLDQSDLPSGCNSCELNYSKGSAETPFTVFLDYSDDHNLRHSSVYYWNITEGKLVNLSDGASVQKISSSGKNYVSTFNSSRVSPSKCADINNDGVIDVPFSKTFSQEDGVENRLSYIQWNKIVFSKDGICAFSDAASEKRVYIDDVNFLKIPAYFDDSKFFAFSQGENKWVFSYGDFTSAKQALGSEGSYFALVEAVNDNEIERYESSGYSLLGSMSEKSGVTLVYKITEYGSAMGLKRDDIFNIK